MPFDVALGLIRKETHFDRALASPRVENECDCAEKNGWKSAAFLAVQQY